MHITIFGSGYVGLVTGICLAEVGNHVLCVDVNERKISSLKQGKIPIYEPGLSELLAKNLAAGRIQFTQNIEEAVAYSAIQCIAVGTPPNSDGSADLHDVLQVAQSIGSYMTDNKTIIVKSTVPVGTTDKVQETIQLQLQKRQIDCQFNMVSNPEFLKEGAAINDFMKPDRIIIGAEKLRAIELMRELYAPFNRNHDRLIVMDIHSAELTKYAANAMLATKISFMNEMATIAEKVGADIEHIRIGIGSDPRIGFDFIYPGAGYGGSCLPKDVQALLCTAQSIGVKADILSAVQNINQAQKKVLLTKIQHYFQNQLKNKRFALWGLAFKPNTDDMRDAPSRVMMEALWSQGAIIQAYDPEAQLEAKRIYGQRDDLQLCLSLEETLENADALIILTEWNAFRSPDFDLLKEKLRQPVIFDGRNLFNPHKMRAKGFTYYAIGRGEIYYPT